MSRVYICHPGSVFDGQRVTSRPIVLRGARGALNPKPSLCGAESPARGSRTVERLRRGVEGWVLRQGTVNWVRSGRKQP